MSWHFPGGRCRDVSSGRRGQLWNKALSPWNHHTSTSGTRSLKYNRSSAINHCTLISSFRGVYIVAIIVNGLLPSNYSCHTVHSNEVFCTKILSSPDVHLRVVSSSLVKSLLVHGKQSTSDHRCPGRQTVELDSSREVID